MRPVGHQGGALTIHLPAEAASGLGIFKDFLTIRSPACRALVRSGVLLARVREFQKMLRRLLAAQSV
jgi:hypothetical protein